eukprot:6225014-Pyramimonas_sp.AAC.1
MYVAHGAYTPGKESRVFATLGTPAFWTCVPLVYCTTHLDDASGVLHFWSISEASLASTLDRYFPLAPDSTRST